MASSSSSRPGPPSVRTAARAVIIRGQDLLVVRVRTEEGEFLVLPGGGQEHGETLTDAVQREVFEESGVRVIAPEYLGSQSWPFPYSLMVGFTARVDPAHTGVPLNPDGVEIEKLRWFSREEIAADSANLLLPGKLSIAGALIEHWYGGPIGS